jgi:hypothetical protein
MLRNPHRAIDLVVALLALLAVGAPARDTCTGRASAHEAGGGAGHGIAPTDDPVTVEPTSSDEVLQNPGKGWVLYFDPRAHTAASLAAGAVGYVRVDWALVEPEEGAFDWAPLEDIVEAFARRGKPCALGVMTANQHSARQYVTPRWVFDAGAPSIAVEGLNVPELVVPESFEDEVFLDRLEAFAAAFGARYDGDPRIAWVDIRSYGNWGEGHIWPWEDEGVRPISGEGLRKHVQLYLDAFPRTRLVLPWGKERYRDVYDWAGDHGVGLRREGVLGNSDGRETALVLGRAPGVFEFYLTQYTVVRDRALPGLFWRTFPDHVDGAPDDPAEAFAVALEAAVEKGHPSYVSLGGWMQAPSLDAAVMAEEQADLVARLTNRMGYHLRVSRLVTPPVFERGRPATVAITWANAGVANIYVPCHVAFALLDEEGEVRARVWCEDCDPGSWAPDTSVTESLELTFDADRVTPGEYQLAVGLFTDTASEAPAIRLANEGRNERGWLPLLAVTVR